MKIHHYQLRILITAKTIVNVITKCSKKNRTLFLPSRYISFHLVRKIE